MTAICTAVLLATPAAMAQTAPQGASAGVQPGTGRWMAIAGRGGGPVVYSSGPTRNGTGRGGLGSFGSPSGYVGRGGLVSLRSDVGYLRAYRAAESASSTPDAAAGTDTAAATSNGATAASNGAPAASNGAVVVNNGNASGGNQTGGVDTSFNGVDPPAVNYTNSAASTLSPSYYDGQSSMGPSYYNTWRAPSAGWIPWSSGSSSNGSSNSGSPQ